MWLESSVYSNPHARTPQGDRCQQGVSTAGGGSAHTGFLAPIRRPVVAIGLRPTDGSSRSNRVSRLIRPRPAPRQDGVGAWDVRGRRLNGGRSGLRLVSRLAHAFRGARGIAALYACSRLARHGASSCVPLSGVVPSATPPEARQTREAPGGVRTRRTFFDAPDAGRIGRPLRKERLTLRDGRADTGAAIFCLSVPREGDAMSRWQWRRRS